MRDCPECGEQFEPAAANQTYCTPAHAKRAEKKRARERKRAETALTRQGDYSEADIERALVTLVHYGGSPKKAAEALEEQGQPIPYSTLASWKRTHADRYLTLVEREEPRRKAIAQQVHENAADTKLSIAMEAAERTAENMRSGELNAVQVARLIQPLTTAAAIDRDKAAQLRGEATAVVRHESAKDIEQALKRMGVLVEGEAVEIESA